MCCLNVHEGKACRASARLGTHSASTVVGNSNHEIISVQRGTEPAQRNLKINQTHLGADIEAAAVLVTISIQAQGESGVWWWRCLQTLCGH